MRMHLHDWRSVDVPYSQQTEQKIKQQKKKKKKKKKKNTHTQLTHAELPQYRQRCRRAVHRIEHPTNCMLVKSSGSCNPDQYDVAH